MPARTIRKASGNGQLSGREMVRIEGFREDQRAVDVAERWQSLAAVTGLQQWCSNIVWKVSLPPETR
jgi:hypothetical protein